MRSKWLFAALVVAGTTALARAEVKTKTITVQVLVAVIVIDESDAMAKFIGRIDPL